MTNCREDTLVRLSGKKILVTGGSSGIGLAITEGLLIHGATVAFTHTSDASLQREPVQWLLNRYPRAVPMAVNFCKPFSADQLIESASMRLDGLDVLVNNAAIFSRDSLMETTASILHQTLYVNVAAPFLLIASFARALAKRKQPGGIINVSSLSATAARSRMSAYQCSKAALEMLSTSAAFELAGLGIRSNVIAPGLVATPANEQQRTQGTGSWNERVASIPLGRAGMPTDLVGAAIFLASDESSWVTGAKIVVDGGASTF
nr:SDR family oxidoreductase [Paraburkholderia sp. NMBU_R16]